MTIAVRDSFFPDMIAWMYFIVAHSVALSGGHGVELAPGVSGLHSGRSERYPGGTGVEPEWTQEVMADVDMLAFEPDPKSRMGASRFIGRSPSAGRVVVVIAYRDPDGDLHGINAWPATGADLRIYE